MSCTLLGFEAAVADPDYLLRVITADLGAYQRPEDDVLSALPGVQRLNSMLVMKQVVQDRPLPSP